MAKAANTYHGTGRRKKSIARVYLKPGKGEIVINKRPIDDYFGMETLKVIVRQPLVATETTGKYDVITANPPYIQSKVIDTLTPEVREHEPRLALDGDEDGLAFYRRLASECPAHLNSGGRVYYEIGYDQGEAVCALLREGRRRIWRRRCGRRAGMVLCLWRTR